MKRREVSSEEFVDAYLIAVKEGLTTAQFAARMGQSAQYVLARVANFAKHDCPLPPLAPAERRRPRVNWQALRNKVEAAKKEGA